MNLFKTLTAVIAITGLAACSKVNEENYNQLKMGMDKSEVEAILGTADSCSDKLTESCLWGEKEGNHIRVEFVSDYVAAYSKKIQ